MMAESDIRATANALAIELIGRPVDDKELDKITKRMRGAEIAQPQITTSTTGSSVTQQGLTSQGREDILRDLISKNPEYQDFQVDTTVLDAMTGFINEKKRVSGG
jgi:transglutaminase/protease-like cytokinesis protein 3